MRGVSVCCVVTVLCVCLTAVSVHSEEPAQTEVLKQLSIDALMDIEVVSVFKRMEKLRDVPSSLFVITADDIRRSGANSLPEVLRLAPNLQVAQRDPVQYAISARGFNNAVGNKLLVLIDGRTVYTPLFSGVFWEQNNLMLEDIERIEVISGPGATLWGANAVNGVINIITKSSHETSGALVSGDLGNADRALGARYGGRLNDTTTYRVYGKYDSWGNFKSATDVDQLNEWNRKQVGFRMDRIAAVHTLTVQGDFYDGESEHRGFVQTLEITPVTITGANILTRWSRKLNENSELQLQAYYDHIKRDDFVLFRSTSDLFDIELLHSWNLGRHQIVSGGGYRYATDDVPVGLLLLFVPSSRNLNWGNIFLQDEIRLDPALAITLGMKLERNEYSGTEYLPNFRLAWKASDKQLFWGAISRAVRAPSRLDREIFFPATPPFLVIGGPNFQSEVANVYEIGYRGQPWSVLGFSITGYAHDWDKLRSGTAVPVELENKIKGWVYGVESWSNYQFSKLCSVNAGFAILREDLELESGSTDPVGTNNPQLRNDPDYQWMVGSNCDLTSAIDFHFDLRGIDDLPTPPLSGYRELNIRVGWKVRKDLELSVVGRNLLHERHPEFGEPASLSQVERSFFVRVTWKN